MAATDQNTQPNIPFKLRFKAWWEGVSTASLLIEGDGNDYESNPKAIHIEDEIEEDLEYWNLHRLEFLNDLWGGSPKLETVIPGGADLHLDLSKPMGLDASKTVLDLAAGLGGGARSLVQEFKVWVDGLESDPELAQKGDELSQKYGMGRRTPIKAFDPDNLELKANRYDVVIMRESMYKFVRKDPIIKQIYSGLKAGGQFTMTDFALKSESSHVNPAIKAWSESLPEQPYLWSMDEYKQSILNARMTVHIHEDISDKFKGIVLTSWQSYVERLADADLNRRHINQLMSEAKHWLLLVGALETGELRFMRLHASKGHETIK